ncbi:ABC-type transport auxiliary lipoprotein family protein [Fundidesulfovibrio magnetotacticus]|nr:ABC-type transport auxiliary lipoprotein family protein [Fundidesulfovibrio magnetotacticus]
MLCLLLLSGCLGKPGPSEEYLRLGQAGPCQDAQPGERHGVALRKLRVVEALDRQSVQLSEGRILLPSQRYYWESAPGRMAESAVAAALECSKSLTPVWPVRYDSAYAMGVTGVVERFEVQTREMAFVAQAVFQAWDASGGRLLGSRSVFVSVPLGSLDAQAIATAGAQGLERLGAEVRAWLEGLPPQGKGK